MSDEEPSYLSDAHRDIDYFANTYIEDEDERGQFFDAFMERTGHTKASSWAPPEEKEPERKGYSPKKRAAPKKQQGEQGGSYFNRNR